MNTFRVPISKDEYYALKTFSGVLAALDSYAEVFLNRLRLIPNGLKRWRWLRSVCDGVFKDMLATVPQDKLEQFKLELENCKTTVFTAKAKDLPKEYAYVDAEAVNTLIDQVMQDHCLVCDLDGKECRSCPIRCAIDGCVSWDTKSIQKGHCVYNGLTSLEE